MKTPYKMTKYPTSDYSVKYCIENGLLLGGTYYLHKYDGTTVYIKIITDLKIVEVGSKFFTDHFEKDLRTINLEKLGI